MLEEEKEMDFNLITQHMQLQHICNFYCKMKK